VGSKFLPSDSWLRGHNGISIPGLRGWSGPLPTSNDCRTLLLEGRKQHAMETLEVRCPYLENCTVDASIQ
jgi:hypothetical protein